METGACSILNPISFCRATRTQLSKSPRPSILSFSSSSPSLSNFLSPCMKLHRSRTTHCSSSSGLSGSNSNAKDLAVLLEVEGVLVDIYRLGNCQAFNSAFQKLGLDCANWTEPIYLDLARKAGGDEERMLVLFFNRIGWPTSLPTGEKEKFMKSVLREKKNALEDFVTTKSLPLRPGVENFIDDALRENIPVVILIAYSKIGDKMARSIIEKLGHERTSKINIVGKEEVEGSFYGQLVLGKGVSSSLDEQLAKEVKRAASVEKQRVAKEVASMLKLSVDINTSPSESMEKIVSTLRAGAEYGGLPVHQCVLIAGSQSGVLGANNIEMPCVVLRSRQLTFPRNISGKMGFLFPVSFTASHLAQSFLWLMLSWMGLEEQTSQYLNYATRDGPNSCKIIQIMSNEYASNM